MKKVRKSEKTKAARQRTSPSSGRQTRRAKKASATIQTVPQTSETDTPAQPIENSAPEIDAASERDGTHPNAPATGAGAATAQAVRQAPGAAAKAIRAAEGTLRNASAAPEFVTQEDFDRLLELVSQLAILQAAPLETQSANARLKALEQRVEEVALQFRNNRNSGPGG